MSLEKAESTKISRFRRIFAQVLATTVQNLFIVEAGAVFSLQMIIIASMTGNSNENNQNEFIQISAVQATWLGSISYLFLPIGSLLSIFSSDILGRKRSMIIVNIPLIIGWYLLYRSYAFWEILAGFAALGLGMGAMDANMNCYFVETCESTTRSLLMAYSTICAPFGTFTVFFLNNILPWRSIALICLSMAVITLIAICWIPETPLWLLSKNRTTEAEKSLRWLRGWVSKEAVAKEFCEIQQQHGNSKSCNACIKQNLQCTHSSTTWREKYIEFKRKRTLKPIFIIVPMIVIIHFSGLLSMSTFIVQIFKAYEIPITTDEAITIMSFTDSLGIITFIALVPFIGKRHLFLGTLFGIFLSLTILTWYGYTFFPRGFVTFDHTHNIVHLKNANFGYIPLVCLILWSFFGSCGFVVIPFILICEIFTFKIRCIATGSLSTFSYIIAFIGIKTYYSLETTLSFPGVTLFYSISCGFGLVLMYNILPETKNRSLEDIELHFSDNSKRITNKNIANSNTILNVVKESIEIKEKPIENGQKFGVDNKSFEIET